MLKAKWGRKGRQLRPSRPLAWSLNTGFGYSPTTIISPQAIALGLIMGSWIDTIKIKTFLAFELFNDVFIMLINVKMPSIVGISTYMSMVNFVLS